MYETLKAAKSEKQKRNKQRKLETYKEMQKTY